MVLMDNFNQKYIKWGNQSWNQAPQGHVHIKTKILLPWPIDLCFKTTFSNVYGLPFNVLSMIIILSTLRFIWWGLIAGWKLLKIKERTTFPLLHLGMMQQARIEYFL